MAVSIEQAAYFLPVHYTSSTSGDTWNRWTDGRISWIDDAPTDRNSMVADCFLLISTLDSFSPYFLDSTLVLESFRSAPCIPAALESF
jgi:hypothetical protein